MADLRQATAHWVTRDTVLWNIEPEASSSYALHYSQDASMTITVNGLEGNYETLALTLDTDGFPDAIREKFPHLSSYEILKLETDNLSHIRDVLKCQLAISVKDDQGNWGKITGVQLPGVLDDLFTYEGELGLVFDRNTPLLRLWAPTARSVKFRLYEGGLRSTDWQTLNMDHDAERGIWSIKGEPEWKNEFYLYEVEVYAPSTGKIETNLVTDPYAVSLAINSELSQIINLNSDEWLPEQWDHLKKPMLIAPEDTIIYELHLRDFSIMDETVPEELRGTYLAFTVEDSDGMKHLKALSDAGLSHIHLLPVFDFATVDDDPATWKHPDYEALKKLPPDSDQQQAAIGAIRHEDGYNWGYDPYHFGVPEGSYATDPNGAIRILEFRQMVQALNRAGLRVVMDVVYNHTHASGQDDESVLDRIVPGYYYRLDENGIVCNSTCCSNTATEHNMMRKLMIDTMIRWAVAYKVDGFRFDLMGHHMLEDVIAVRDALGKLTLAHDGVDGRKIVLYGEGWDFGEVAGNQRGINASQQNIGGTGIGVFNDRLRDAVRGGAAHSDLQQQGFATGLSTAPNGITYGSDGDQLSRLLAYSDWIRASLAGNLKDFEFTASDGKRVRGDTFYYHGQVVGFTDDPQENVIYVSAHDNDTLWDTIQVKAPMDLSLDNRVRMHNLALSLVAMAQGIPFLHAGVDMLRSKSLDVNSYDSGAWFNRLNFSYKDNNFGVGLPPEWNNKSLWELQGEILKRADLKPTREHIMRSVMHLREMLQIRTSSRLFRLPTSERIHDRLDFHNTGREQIPGVIVMGIADRIGADLDPVYDGAMIIFNARLEEITFRNSMLRFTQFRLHPVQQESHDPIVRESKFDQTSGSFTVPALTTAVFMLPDADLIAEGRME